MAMSGKSELEKVIARIESGIKSGDARDPKKKAELVKLLRQLKAGVKKEDHGPLDDLISALEESAMGLEASHPTLTAYLGHVSRLLASIGI